MRSTLLGLAGLLSSAVALLHVVMVPIGTPTYRYFTAPESLVRLSEQGSPLPALVTLGLAGIFAVWGLYGFSGAGLIRRLPLLKAGLAGIGAIYIGRGLLLLPQVTGHYEPTRGLAFSAASLAIGSLYLIGLARSWERLLRARPAPPATVVSANQVTAESGT